MHEIPWLETLAFQIHLLTLDTNNLWVFDNINYVTI